MAARYDDIAKEKAYRLFVIGKSITEIAKEMKRDFPTVSKSTVSKWAKEKDARGLTWDERRTAIVTARETNLDSKLSLVRKKILEQSFEIKEKLYGKMLNADVKTFEGAVFAFGKISEFILELSEAEKKNPHPIEVIQTFMTVLSEIPEVRDSIEKHWDEIQKMIALRLENRE